MSSLPLALFRVVTQSVHASTRDLPRAFWFLWLGTLVNRMGTFVAPFLTLYLSRELRVTDATIALLVATFSAGAVVSLIVGGAVADRFGRRGVLIAGLVLGAAMLLVLARARSVPALGAALFALGLVGELHRPATWAMATDLVPPAARPRAFAHLYWAINLGFAIAPVLAGALVARGYALLFVLDAVTTLACAALVFRFVPEPKLPHTPEPLSLPGLFRPLADRVFLAFFATSVALTLAFFQFSVALPLAMKADGLGDSTYGWVLAVNGALIVLVQPFATSRVLRFRRSRVLAVASALSGIGVGLHAFADTGLGHAGAVAVWTLGEILMSPINPSIVADLSTPTTRARYQGTFALSWALGQLLAPLVGVGALTRWGEYALWAGCAALGILAAVGQLVQGPWRKRRLIALGSEAARSE